MKIGYARVSTKDQDYEAQVNALKGAGVDRVFEEKASGARFDRPELQRMMEHCRSGDVLVVWKLDRLSRSLRDLLTILDQLEEKGVGFISLTESIDTTSAAGRMLMQMIGAFAEFERQMIRERTRAGLDRAKTNGTKLGRPRKMTKSQKEKAIELLKMGDSSAEVARTFNVHPSTICRLKKGIEGVHS